MRRFYAFYSSHFWPVSLSHFRLSWWKEDRPWDPKLERLYLSKTGQASSSLLFYSTQWMEIRIRNHSGLNGRASALAPTPVICLPVSSGYFYLIFKEWDHDNELSLTFTVDYFHRHSARADHYFLLWYCGCKKSVLGRFWLLLLRSHSWTTVPTSSWNISAAK